MMCTRYQRRHCILLSDPDATIEYCVEKSNLSFADIDYDDSDLIAYIDPSYPTSKVSFSKHLFSFGFHFYCERKHTVVVMDFEETEYDPIFWIVVHIPYLNCSWHLILRKLVVDSSF